MHSNNSYAMHQTAILFVCLGNICRSPAAEGIMKHLTRQRYVDDQFFIDSAGVGSWHVGELPDRRMRSHGNRHGYCFDSRARQIKHDDFIRFDYIFVMDGENYDDVIALANNDDERRKVLRLADYMTHHPHQSTIPDPYYGGDRDFELVIELLEDACDGLLSYLLRQ